MTLNIGALTKLGLLFPVMCFIHVFAQTLAEHLYCDKGLIRNFQKKLLTTNQELLDLFSIYSSFLCFYLLVKVYNKNISWHHALLAMKNKSQPFSVSRSVPG